MPGSLAIGNEHREEAAAMRRVRLAAFLALAYVPPELASAAELRQETVEAFNRYVQATEDRMAEGLRDGCGDMGSVSSNFLPSGRFRPGIARIVAGAGENWRAREKLF